MPGSISLGGGHPIGVNLFYDGASTLFLTFTDTVAALSYSTNIYVGSISNTVGGSSAFVGFSGATGGATSIQTITNFSFIGGLFSGTAYPPLGQFIFATNSNWKYFKGLSEASSPDATAWRNVGFDDGAWSVGAAPFYFENNPGPGNPYAYTGNTALTDMPGSYSCVFLRQSFVLSNASQIATLQLSALSDDGFVAYINGTEVARYNLPGGNIPYNGRASTDILEPASVQNFVLANPQSYLVPGTNVIAVQALTSSLTNSSFIFSAQLSASIQSPWSNVGISEFMATNKSTVQDVDGDYSPWIELYNPTTNDISLAGWSLTDDTNNLTKWQFPNVVLLDADDANGSDNFMVVFASGKNRVTVTNELHTNFKLSPAGGYLALVNSNGNIVSSFSYPPQQADVSYGRDMVNQNVIGFLMSPTPGDPNVVAGADVSSAVAFSQSGSTFSVPFFLQLSAASTNAVIRYTLDGSLPTSDSTVYTGPLQISQSVQVRARSFTDGLMPGSASQRKLYPARCESPEHHFGFAGHRHL